MQPKILIVIVLVFIGGLVAYNVMNTSKLNDSINDNTSVEAKPSSESKGSEGKIIDKPLAQQPKAMVDKASGAADDIEKAQQEQQQKMDEAMGTQ